MSPSPRSLRPCPTRYPLCTGGRCAGHRTLSQELTEPATSADRVAFLAGCSALRARDVAPLLSHPHFSGPALHSLLIGVGTGRMLSDDALVGLVLDSAIALEPEHMAHLAYAQAVTPTTLTRLLTHPSMRVLDKAALVTSACRAPSPGLTDVVRTSGDLLARVCAAVCNTCPAAPGTVPGVAFTLVELLERDPSLAPARLELLEVLGPQWCASTLELEAALTSLA